MSVPGPAKYNIKESLIIKNNGSYSIRAKTPAHNLNRTIIAPGPGHYDISKVSSIENTQVFVSKFKSNGASVSFGKSQRPRFENFVSNKYFQPGPGSYENYRT